MMDSPCFSQAIFSSLSRPTTETLLPFFSLKAMWGSENCRIQSQRDTAYITLTVTSESQTLLLISHLIMAAPSLLRAGRVGEQVRNRPPFILHAPSLTLSPQPFLLSQSAAPPPRTHLLGAVSADMCTQGSPITLSFLFQCPYQPCCSVLHAPSRVPGNTILF